MPECQADVSRHLGGVVNLTMSEQYIRAIWLAAKREDLASSNLTHPLWFAAGVLDRSSDKLVSHGPPLWVLMA